MASLGLNLRSRNLQPLIRGLALTALLVGLPLLSPARPAMGQNPQEVFDRCVEAVGDLAQRCRDANYQVARECIPEIRRLVRLGRVEEARALAARCIQRINRQTDICEEQIRQRCHRCVQLLRQLGAPRLAVRLLEYCHRVAGMVRASQERTVSAIKQSLPH